MELHCRNSVLSCLYLVEIECCVDAAKEELTVSYIAVRYLIILMSD